ncbi:general stress protein 26 [Anaerotaenia torta]|uniref:pyridoxamine 5'-phosphate oxidase family protein n=1 Tax=Anaerotaenia torta TaxID=433293 RepID=UPI003D2010E8
MKLTEKVLEDVIKQVDDTRDVIVCSVDENGMPNAKAMFLRSHEGLHTFWFSSNVSASRTKRWQENPKACLYFLNSEEFRGLMVTGELQVCMDDETKKRFFEPGDINYYPQGPTDPDYCMLRFTADKGNYWYQGKYEFEAAGL